MSRFEFLMMIAAVVVAVGMTEIVGGWGRLMRTRVVVKPDWLHLGWTVVILFSLIQYWVGMWSYNQLPIDYMGQIFFLIIPTLFGVLAAFAITPDVPMEQELDVREYYWAKRRAVFLPLAAYVAMALIADLVIVGVDKVEMSEVYPLRRWYVGGRSVDAYETCVGACVCFGRVDRQHHQIFVHALLGLRRAMDRLDGGSWPKVRLARKRVLRPLWRKHGDS